MEKKYKKIALQFLIALITLNLLYVYILMTDNTIIKTLLLVSIASYISYVYAKYDYYYTVHVFLLSLLYFPLSLLAVIVIKRSKYTTSVTNRQENLTNIISFDTINQYYYDLSQSIKNASESIIFQKYILRMDTIGVFFINLLIEASKRGVKVDIILDDLLLVEQDKNLLISMIEGSTIKLKLTDTECTNWFKTLNSRNHRKVVIIDSKIIYTGGSNIATEYVSLNSKYPLWEDSHFRFNSNSSLLENQAIIDGEMTLELDLKKQNNSNSIIYLDNQEIVELILKDINQAKSSIRVYSPYLAIPRKNLQALENAIKRGVHVEFYIPQKHDNKRLAYQVTLDYANKLVNLGADVYYAENTFIHTKFMVIDQNNYFGTLNYDIRAMYFNKEILVKYTNNNQILYEMKNKKRLKYQKTKIRKIDRILGIYLGIFN